MTFLRDRKGVSTGEARCDGPDCQELAPKPLDWMKANPDRHWPGWNNLGWFCAGGKHYCPKHVEKDTA